MKITGTPEVEHTLEEWKARALAAERGLYYINAMLCENSLVYGDDGDSSEDMNDLGEAIWEAAELELDEVPVPADAVRRNSDVRPPGNDRRLFAIHNVWSSEQGGLVAVARQADSQKANDLLYARWRELCDQAGLNLGAIRYIHVDLHNPGTKKSPEVHGWSETELRTLLLEHEPDGVQIVGERFTAAPSQS